MEKSAYATLPLVLLPSPQKLFKNWGKRLQLKCSQKVGTQRGLEVSHVALHRTIERLPMVFADFAAFLGKALCLISYP